MLLWATLALAVDSATCEAGGGTVKLLRGLAAVACAVQGQGQDAIAPGVKVGSAVWPRLRRAQWPALGS